MKRQITLQRTLEKKISSCSNSKLKKETLKTILRGGDKINKSIWKCIIRNQRKIHFSRTLVSRSTFFSQISFFFPPLKEKDRLGVKSRRAINGTTVLEYDVWGEHHRGEVSRMKMQESYFPRATETFIMTVFFRLSFENDELRGGQKFRGRTR